MQGEEATYALSKHRLSHKGAVMDKRRPLSFLVFLSLSWIIFVVFAETAVSAPTHRPELSATAVTQCPSLAPPSGNVVNVATVAALENAVNTAVSGQTILIADGIYNLNGVYLRVDVPNVTLRSQRQPGSSGFGWQLRHHGNYPDCGFRCDRG